MVKARGFGPRIGGSSPLTPAIYNKEEDSVQHKITQQEIALIEKAINSGSRAEVGVERGEVTIIEIKRKLLSVKERQKTT